MSKKVKIRGPVVVCSASSAASWMLSTKRGHSVKGVLSIADLHNMHRSRPSGLNFVPFKTYLTFDDVVSWSDPGAPTLEDAQRILTFADRFKSYFDHDPREPHYDDEAVLGRPRVLIHCYAGQCRSTAAAVAAYAYALGPGREHDAVQFAALSAEQAVADDPCFLPSRFVLEHVDTLLDRKGALVRAASSFSLAALLAA